MVSREIYKRKLEIKERKKSKKVSLKRPNKRFHFFLRIYPKGFSYG